MSERPGRGADKATRKRVGKRIEERKEALGLSHSRLGAKLRTRDGKPVSIGQVSKWVRGENLPSNFYWEQLAVALRTTIGDLFGDLVSADDGLADRVGHLEAEVATLIRILDLEDSVESALRAKLAADRATAQRAATEPVADDGVEEHSPRKTARKGRRRQGDDVDQAV